MVIERRDWGVLNGKKVELFTMTNAHGLEVSITNYGGAIVSLKVPDKDGMMDDITLGYDCLNDYIAGDAHFGALIGRHANRIEGARFELNGTIYELAKNDGPNHLHGGPGGFGRVVWKPAVIEKDGEQALELRYFSPDGEENYPGNLDVKVIYSFTPQNELRIDYQAEPDQDTVVNLTNHAYFNLAGHDGGTILDHELTLYAEEFTPINEECVPIGEICSVKGTPFDFTSPKKIGTHIDADDEQIRAGKGYDHNWVIKRDGEGLVKAAEAYHPKTGRVLEVFTTKPGIQFYTGNFLDGSDVGKGGFVYGRRSGFCLETQYFPNALKHKHFPSPVTKGGETYRHSTVFRFSTR
ncbi:MAG: galactose mutarotase [Firmicutes bacterium]|nr:galactose mutarotase [Bacillota bacterium]